jgi:glutamate-1-semialdehyde 2,1-aminomutase
MHDALQKEIATYEKRTPGSAAAHKRALERIPLGVASNYRHYEPYPLFVKDGKGSKSTTLTATSISTTTCVSAR